MLISRASYLPLAALGFTFSAFGCSSGAAEATSSSGSGSGGGQFDAGGTVSTLETTMGPIAAHAGQENTQCVTVNLNNTDGAFVRRFRADLGVGSHHMIAYTSQATVEDRVPTDCAPFSGILSGMHPIFIAQQAKSDLVFPTDENGVPVGFEIKPHQMLKIEMHYIDASTAPIEVTGKIFLDTVPLTTAVTKSDLSFAGTTNINIPANGSFDTQVQFQPALEGTKTFALTTHQHHLGTEMQVWYSNGVNDTATRIADGTNWSDPPLQIFSPALDFTSPKGFAYECKWINPTPNPVSFGESVNDEMCFFWNYYYPSQGFQFCTDGQCQLAP